MIYSVDVEITAPVKATEVGERVADAVQNIFPSADVEVTSEEVRAETHDVEEFREKLFEQRILDTARGRFREGRTEDGFTFDLKKQAARQGVVNFSVGSPDELGDIHVEVTVHEPSVERFVAYLTPETEAGEPVVEEDDI
ncbi:RNA-binding domain-containing protein [Halospeciosus flavus]|uniref:UPF0201 protein ACFQJ9_17140 n=1 Tax=Halospeciosus flavus TaxID=3032283 RepID=A0ABD5Z796_9EURY|nr:RNA-binding domain-containing protein [Halospeciosus flavus]